MNILIVNLILHTHEKGVIPRHKSNHDCMIYNMARGFVANGHRVTLAASEEYRPELPDAEDFKIVYLPSKLPQIFKPSLIPWPCGLRELIKEGCFDVIISSETFQIASLQAVRTAKVPVVIWQEMAVHQRKMKKIPSKLWHNLVAPLLMRKAIVVGRSAAARDFISKYMPIVRQEYVDHGCNSSIFYPSNECDDSFIIVSQLIERKQPLKMLRAFMDFVHRPGREGYKLHVIGRGPLLEDMRLMAKEGGIEDNVMFHGFLPHSEFAAIGRRAKGMLVNTLQDLNMVSIPEAIINGTPVLMNTVPYTASFVNDKGLGIARDDWGADELEQMADGYGQFHAACVAIRDTLTEKAAAKRLADLAFRP